MLWNSKTRYLLTKILLWNFSGLNLQKPFDILVGIVCNNLPFNILCYEYYQIHYMYIYLRYLILPTATDSTGTVSVASGKRAFSKLK